MADLQQATHRQAPLYLVIDTSRVNPIYSIVEAGGRRVGTTRILPEDQISSYALWLGMHGGRRLLDAFELRLINEGVLHIEPMDEDGIPLRKRLHVSHKETEALAIVHTDKGSRIEWALYADCCYCDGDGHFGDIGDDPKDDECHMCDGTGRGDCYEFTTDMDGRLVEPLA